MPLQLRSHLHGNVYVVRCTGAIVLGDEAHALEAALEKGAEQAHRLVLNLAKVNRVDSLGLGLLVRFCTRLGRRGGDLRLAETPEVLIALLKLTALTRLFKLYRSEEEAVNSFRKLGALPSLPVRAGTQILVFDPSPDLCVFLRSVLAYQGFYVRTASALAEATRLLDEQTAEMILLGPCTAQLPPAIAAATLAEHAPQAEVLRLQPDFKSLDAQQATAALLALLAPEN